MRKERRVEVSGSRDRGNPEQQRRVVVKAIESTTTRAESKSRQNFNPGTRDPTTQTRVGRELRVSRKERGCDVSVLSKHDRGA